MHISQRGSEQALVGKAVIFVHRKERKRCLKEEREQERGERTESGGREGKERCRIS